MNETIQRKGYQKHDNLRFAPYIALATVLMFFLLPRSFNFITFFVPAIYVSTVLSRDGRGFNTYVFLFVLLLSVLIPTGFLTLDTSGDIIIPSAQPTMELVIGFQFWINLGIVVLAFIIPAVVIAWTVGQLMMSGNEEEEMKMIVKMAIIIILFFVLCFVMDLMGLLPSWFIWRYIRDFFIWIVQIFQWIGNFFGAIFSGQVIPSAPIFPDLGAYNLTEIINNADTIFPSLGTDQSASIAVGSLPWIFVNVTAIIPFVLATIGVVVWQLERDNQKPYIWINNILGEKNTDDLKIKLVKFNAPAVIFGVAVLLYAFAMFLNFGDSGIDISLYTIITAFCLILLATGLIPIKTGKPLGTFEGVIFGIGGVFFFYNVLSMGLSVIDFSGSSQIILILNQIFFVAPTESLIFHVIIPGLGMLGTYYLFRRSVYKSKNEELERKRVKIELEISKVRQIILTAERENAKSVSYQGKKMTVQNASNTVFNLQNQLYFIEREKEKTESITLNRLVYSKIQYTALIIVLCFIVPNFIFSTYHTFKAGLDILDFWVRGIGFIYLGAGCWLTFIAIRFGWLPCILAHAGINIISILLMGASI